MRDQWLKKGSIMRFAERVAALFRGQGRDPHDPWEDPRETIDFFYELQLESLQKIRRNAGDAANYRKRFEIQLMTIEQESQRLEKQRELALSNDQEDVATEALARLSRLEMQRKEATRQFEQLKAQEDSAMRENAEATAKVDSLRMQKEFLKSTYSVVHTKDAIRSRQTTRRLPAESAMIDELIPTDLVANVAKPLPDPDSRI
jgi:phage shock protein A